MNYCKTCLFMLVTIVVFYACTPTTNEEDLNTIARDALVFAQEQYTIATEQLEDSLQYPRSMEEDGSLLTTNSRSWTSGFFPGVLWYLYDYSNEEKWKNLAAKWTAGIEEQKTYRGTHDLGFMIFCSFGNGYRLTQNEHYKDVILEASQTLSTRYNPTVGCIRSWDFGDWQFPVIIDNMMNLEMLFWTAENSDMNNLYDLSVTHANTTIENHYRDDYSCYHVVDYDTITGEPIWKGTHQGYSDDSDWARGQAWGLYGYVLTYKKTKDSML